MSHVIQRLLSARTFVVAPVALAVVLGAGCGSKQTEAQHFCSVVKKGGGGALVIDPAAITNKSTAKAAIDKLAASKLLSIKDGDVPKDLLGSVTALRTGFVAFRDQMAANDYDFAKIDLGSVASLQVAATTVSAYLKTNCGIDVTASTTAASTAATTTTPGK